MKNSKMNMVISIVIFLIVIAGLVLITINKKNSMNQTQQPEEQGNITSENNSGVKTVILKEGTGEVSKAGDIVSVNYTGSLVDGTVFDSNIDPKFGHVQPFEFQLSGGQVIPGWDIGVAGMKVGEVRKLEIVPELAYGAAGAGNGKIPPNATLVFEVELLGINK